jgi:ketosteroid isomerase-like protein
VPTERAEMCQFCRHFFSGPQGLGVDGAPAQRRDCGMSRNKQTVETYIDGFNKSDHAQILSCLTDDIEWTVFGYFRLQGKEAYDLEIENPAFTGKPNVTITRMVEENDVVMAEMTLEARRADGEPMRAAMAEVFVMHDGKIKERRAYVIELKENDYR